MLYQENKLHANFINCIKPTFNVITSYSEPCKVWKNITLVLISETKVNNYAVKIYFDLCTVFGIGRMHQVDSPYVEKYLYRYNFRVSDRAIV